ncbi:hypothetical protein AY498_05630 [Corynebacterium ulcerans]|uniref:Hypothetical membrane protein n=1 Tax=Corynebacterium ulcerans TaxID=65058 RepID=A0ABD7MTY7_CORUL|nr:hypothetical protein [Corynebacterium ulcerans]AEG80859.1 putative membrane protein [Corynebacterium ulcerans 809]AEG83041.1 putative membrane protein [Corynebacterium ulcerans BR-AD22]AIT88304.1 Hypothetical protein Cul210932_0336 [Corynebacterium ulcerans]AIU29686.1 Hypothetical protein Cul210931_0321 [Corynebacterium ulcerans]ALD94072.1 Hypothetical protein Cul131001_0341 [Corynebacterium ulcerans]
MTNQQQRLERSPSQPTTPDAKRERPDAIRWAVRVWIFAICVETVHQIINIIVGFANKPELISKLKESMKDENLSPEIMNLAAVFSIILAGLFSLIVLCVIAWLAVLLYKGNKSAALARRILTYFSIYFGVRLVTVFLLTPSSPSVPVAVYAVDGCVQICMGVAAIVALIFKMRPETLAWTGEWENSRGKNGHS